MNNKNPWKTLSSKIVFENEWISVQEDQVIRPDGDPGTYTYVNTRIATGALALTEDNQVYLVGQYRYPLDVYSWEIPEGGTDDGETPLETAKRELKEEAGVVAESWEPLGGVIHLSNCISSEEGFLFLARDLTEVEASPEGTEDIRIKKVPFSKALEMVESGEITDSLSIIAILRASIWLSDY